MLIDLNYDTDIGQMGAQFVITFIYWPGKIDENSFEALDTPTEKYQWDAGREGWWHYQVFGGSGIISTVGSTIQAGSMVLGLPPRGVTTLYLPVIPRFSERLARSKWTSAQILSAKGNVTLANLVKTDYTFTCYDIPDQGYPVAIGDITSEVANTGDLVMELCGVRYFDSEWRLCPLYSAGNVTAMADGKREMDLLGWVKCWLDNRLNYSAFVDMPVPPNVGLTPGTNITWETMKELYDATVNDSRGWVQGREGGDPEDWWCTGTMTASQIQYSDLAIDTPMMFPNTASLTLDTYDRVTDAIGDMR